MRHLVWLLFLLGKAPSPRPEALASRDTLTNPPRFPAPLIAWTGACLSIPCCYQSCLLNPRRPNNPTISSLAWYLNPGYDPEKKDFSGTVPYKHSTAISLAIAGCVRFLGDLEGDCSLQLSDLRASENGSYGLRPIASNTGQKQEKWMTEINSIPSPPGARDQTQESWAWYTQRNEFSPAVLCPCSSAGCRFGIARCWPESPGTPRWGRCHGKRYR
uniref:Immunoglobulin V-set domain-containing protein n=1 Tax=Terrapene triunguis TaxID=2587831 RepID=A0A674K5W3_9SAUR